LPLALGIGTGAKMLQPLAIVLISVLIIQLPLVLLLLPNLLTQFRITKHSLELQ
jgi:multidrug efflux pump subunit AcrB